MSKIRTLKEIFEEAPEQVAKIIKALKGESDDAVAKLGSGKNLDELKKAQQAIAEKARASQPPAYPKNVVQDELAQRQGFKLEGAPYTKEAVMVPEGTALPALRKQTLPEIIETTATKIDDTPIMSKIDDTINMPKIEPTMSKANPSTLAETADALKGSVDDALTPGMSLKKKAAIAAAVAATVGAAKKVSTDNGEQPSTSVAPQPKKQTMPAANQESQVSKEQKIEKDQTTTNADIKVAADKADQIVASLPEEQKPKTQEEATRMKLDYAVMLLDAQRRDDQQALLNNLLRAGTTIGAAIAGVKPDYSGVESLQSQSGKNVAQVKSMIDIDKQQKATDKAQRELDDETKMADPSSDISKQMRGVMAKAGYPVDDKVSAKQLKDMGVPVYNLLAQEKQQQTSIKLAEIKERASASADALKEGKNKQSFISGAQKVLLKPYQEYQKVNSAYNAVQQFSTSKPSGAKDIAMLYSFIKTLDPGSMVKEGEIALSQRGMSLFEGLGLKAKRITSGELLNDNFRREILEIGRQAMEQAHTNYQEVARPFIVNASSMGLSDDDMSKFDYMSANKMKQATEGVKNQQPTESTQPQQTSQMVTVQRLSDGMTKVVPASSVTNMDIKKYKIVGQ